MDEGFNTFSTRARDRAGLRRRTTWRCATSAASSRGCSRTSALSRETDGNRLAGYRRNAKSDAQSTPTLPVLPVDRRQHHLQQDGAVAEHARALARLARAAAHRCPRTSRAGSSSTRSRMTSLPSRTRSAGSDLSWFFDQVYRSSNVFDYGVQDLRSDARTATTTARRWSRGGTARPFSRSMSASRSPTAACRRALGRPGSLAACTPTIGRNAR